MQAYVVFAGGGVRGIAHAGCLSALNDLNVEVLGVGGTSAGAIVASLASVGYTGKELEKSLKHELHPRKWFADDGIQLQESLRRIRGFINAVPQRNETRSWFDPRRWCAGIWDGFMLSKLCYSYYCASGYMQSVHSHLGIDSGESLRTILNRKFTQRLGASDPAGLTFGHAVRCGAKPLKVVVSHPAGNRALVFPINEGDLVVDAVAASAAFPFAFIPAAIPGYGDVVDGGLASNLPSFLFCNERFAAQAPVLAFDLVSACDEDLIAATPYKRPTLVDYVGQLLNTALGASDVLIGNMLTQIIRIEVKLTAKTNVFKIDLSDEDVAGLIRDGYSATMKEFNTNNELRVHQHAGEDVRKCLQARYAAPDQVEALLWGCQRMVQEMTNAKKIRIGVSLPTGRGTLIGVYNWGFSEEDTDGDLELPIGTYCSGCAFQQRNPVCIDLVRARNGGRIGGLPQDKYRFIRADRRSAVAFPIFAPTNGEPKVRPVLGVLSVDSSSNLTDTQWLRALESGPELDETIVRIGQSWADLIAKLIAQ